MSEQKDMPEIKLSPITGSSQIVAAGYDAASKTMAIQFTNGKSHYRYFDVSPDVFAAFQKSQSKGKFFGSTIRGKFKHSLVPEKKAKA